MKKYGLIIVLLVTFLAACRKDTSIDVTVMPEETTIGANTFGCLIDGWIYVGGRYFDYNKQSINFVYHGSDMDVEVKVKGINSSYPYLAFTMNNPVQGQECTITDAQWRQTSGDKSANNIIDLGSGKVKIIRFDPIAKIISGTFSNDLKSENRITQVRFDVAYR